MHGGTCFCGVWSQYCIIYRFEQIFCALHNWVPCFWRWWSFCPAYWCRVVSNLKLMVLYSNTKDNFLTSLPATKFCRDCHIISQNSSSCLLKFMLFYWSSLEKAHICVVYRLNGSSGACETYGNCCLSQREDFTLKDVEVLQSASLIWACYNLQQCKSSEDGNCRFSIYWNYFNPKLLCQSLPRSVSGFFLSFILLAVSSDSQAALLTFLPTASVVPSSWGTAQL
jgi:hypothetical protein